jgi:DNA-binding SARP family transcriptional activator
VDERIQHAGLRPGERPQAPLRLYLLGRFEAVRADAPIPAHAWRRRRPADLLKLVALAPGRALPRDQVLDALWPEKETSSAANNLHRALYDLRQILGGRWVDVDRGAVALRRDVWVDVDAFEDAVARGGREAWTRAVALYRGDLAPEDLDSPWLHPRREALRERFVEAAFPLARAAAAEGDAQLAVPLLRRILEVDPAAEEAHRLLMRLLAGSGRRGEALRQYDACELAVRAGGAAPSDEARQLRAAIQRGEVGPTRARPVLDGARRAARRLLGTTEPAPVRGRGPLLLLLEALVEQGSGAIVLLGERGVGKTRLAVEGALLAQARGAAVLCGIGGILPGAPYALFADAFREEARAHPALQDPFAVAAHAGVPGEQVRRALFEGAEAALRALADGRFVYLLLDDLHAADESSLNLLHFLARRARPLRLMTVATVSEEAIHAGTPIQAALAHLDCARLARGVRVPRLSLAGTREQVADLAGVAVPEETARRIYAITDGAPLLVEEVVRAQRETGQAHPSDPAAAIRGRVARLGPRADALLAAAAVAGARFDFEPVRLVSGLTAHEAALALDACLEVRLVDEDGAGYHFHHAVVRDAVYDGLAPERRAALHAALADALEALAGGHEPPSEALAYHRRRAGQEAPALRHLVAAGHRAAARAGLREALAFYAAALELCRRDAAPDPATLEPAPCAAAAPPVRAELLDALARVQLLLGECAAAARTFAELDGPAVAGRPRGEPALRARARRLAALALASAGQLAEAHAEIGEGLAAAREAAGEGLAQLLHLEAQLRWHQGRHAEAREAAEACAAAAERAGDADLLARGRDLAALARASAGEPLASPEDATDPAERRRQDAAPDHPFDVHLALWDRDLLGDATATDVGRAAALVAERARMRDAPEAAAAARNGEGAAALAAGDADVAEAILRDALGAHRAAGSALGEALALERLATLLTQAGRLDEARDAVDEGVVVAERGVLRQHALTRLHAVEARNRLAAGALYQAEDAVREASESAARHGECVACDAAFRPEAVRVLLGRGKLAEADAEAEQLEGIARRRGGRVLQAVARLSRARVLQAQGLGPVALAALAEARAAFVAAGHRYEAARCARLEVRIRGGAAVPEDVRALDALVRVDADA